MGYNDIYAVASSSTVFHSSDYGCGWLNIGQQCFFLIRANFKGGVKIRLVALYRVLFYSANMVALDQNLQELYILVNLTII